MENEEQPTQEQQDGANLARVTEFIRAQVQQYMHEQMPQQAVQPEPDAVQRGQQQLTEVLIPYLAPVMLEVADGKDYTTFYRRNADAMEYEEQVEQMFTDLKKQGRAVSRQDILDVLRGREFRADPDKFSEKHTAKRKEQLERAESSSDFGASAHVRAKNDPVWSNFGSLSVEEMEKALDGITF